MSHTGQHCECRLCQLALRIESTIAGREVEPMKEMLLEVYSLYMSTLLDENWASAVIDGSWPNADEIIAHARKKRTDE